MPKSIPLQPKLTEVKIVTEDGRYVVEPHFGGLARPCTCRYSCGTNKQLAERLSDAIVDGAVVTNITYKKDCNGDSYASFTFDIRMRCANADLKRLGY
jgi:hypothetical protein